MMTMFQYKDPYKRMTIEAPEPSKPRKLSKAEKEHRRKQVMKWHLKRAGLNAIMLIILAIEMVGGLYLGEYVTTSCPEHARPFMGLLSGILIAQILIITFMWLREDLVKENSRHPYDSFK